MPAVSVVMPAYNARASLRAAAESVLHQTFADLELIIVDDGSTDDTRAVADGLAAVDPRVRVLSQANAGPGPARNTAFAAARGRYFAFLDSDDEWDPEFLASLVPVLDDRPDVDVLIGNARIRQPGFPRHGQPARPVRAHGQLIPLTEILADETALFIMTVFRREAVLSVGGFDPALLTNEEYEMWIRASLAGSSFARHPVPLGWYTCRPGSLSSSDARMLSGILRVLKNTRPRLAPLSAERTILDRQAARFEGELAAVEAKLSLKRRDSGEAARHLAALHQRRGGWLLGMAARLPRVAVVFYRLREFCSWRPASAGRRVVSRGVA